MKTLVEIMISVVLSAVLLLALLYFAKPEFASLSQDIFGSVRDNLMNALSVFG